VEKEYLQAFIDTLNRQYDHLREDLKGMVAELKADLRSDISTRDRDILELKRKYEEIDRWKWQVSGAILALGVPIQVVIAYLIDYFKK
jgi:hypothetical protein